MARIPYDTLWKNIVSELFDEFLLFFAPELYEKIDHRIKPEFLEQELQQLFADSEDGKRYTDKLAKVQLKDGQEQWILIHVEIQGGYDKHFSERMFRYFYRVFDKYNRKIYTISIFTDEHQNFKPNQFVYDFFGTKLTYQYNTYKIREQDEKSLIKSDNPFAFVILAGLYVIKSKQHSDQKYAFKKKLVQLLIQKQWSKTPMNQLFIFIDTILQLPDKENALFIQDIQPIIEKESERMGLSFEDTSFAEYYRKEGRQEGMQEGRQEGRLEGIEKEKREIAMKMLQKDLSVELIAQITDLTVEQIEELKNKNPS